jgi:hypothetical protein
LHPLPSAISGSPGDIQFTDCLTQCEKLLETDLIFWDFDHFLNHCAASGSIIKELTSNFILPFVKYVDKFQ